MSHPIQLKLSRIRSRARRLWLLHALAWVAAATLAAVAVVCGLDYLLRFEDRGVRAICSLLAGGTLLATVWRFLVPALRTPLRDIDVARRVERKFPHFNDRLASSVQFLVEPDDPSSAGSSMLRRAVVVQATADMDRVEVDSMIESRPVRRVLWIAGAIVASVLAIAALAPRSSALAVGRMLTPWSDLAWPQQTHLRVRDPIQRLAVGEPFEVVVIDERGEPLPQQVLLHVRSGDGEGLTEVIPMQFAPGESVMIYRRESVKRPLWYRATGGDDEGMEEIPLTVVDPPAVTELNVTLEPPAYTAWPRVRCDASFRGLAGTRVAMTGRATRELRSAQLVVTGGKAFTATLGEDRRGFSLPIHGDERDLVLDQSTNYHWRLEDEEGIVGGRDASYDIRVISDAVPTVVLEDPSANVNVTPDATLPLAVLAKDDLALQSIVVNVVREGLDGEKVAVLDLYRGPETAPAPDDATTAAARFSANPEGDDHRATQDFQLAPLKLAPGTTLLLTAVASDYLPQFGTSQPRRVTILTHRELEQLLHDRQSQLLAELSRLLKLQQDARQQVAGAETQLKDVGTLQQREIHQLEAAAMSQRQIERGLASEGEGIRGQIDGLRADIENNRLDNPDLRRRIDEISREIEQLKRQTFAPLESALSRAVKGSEENQGQAAGTPGLAALADDLTETAGHQDNVVAALQRLVDDLSRGAEVGRVYRDLGQLRSDQDALARETAELGQETQSRPPEGLTRQQQVDLKKLAERERDLARRFEKLSDRMEAMLEAVESGDPLAAEALREALEEARALAPEGKMAEAAGNLERNRIGQAAAAQQDASHRLQEILDALANRHEQELSRLVKKLRQAEDELAHMREQQSSLKRRFAEAEKIANPAERQRELQRLTREQRELQQQAQRMARRLQRLQAADAADSAQQAGSKMGQAGEQAEQGAGGKAGKSAADAEQDLEQAQAQVAQRRQQAQADLAFEQLMRMQDTLRALSEREAGLLEETTRLEALREQQGRLTRAQSARVLDLGQAQEALAQEARELGEKLARAGAFKLAMERAVREMLRARDLLAEQETGPATQRAESNAVRRLEQMVEAVEPVSPNSNQPDQEGGDSGGGEQSDIPSDPFTALAEIRLIESMQQELNERTTELSESLQQRGKLTEAEQQEFLDLAEEQGKLAEMLAEMAQANAPENPEELPQGESSQPEENQPPAGEPENTDDAGNAD